MPKLNENILVFFKFFIHNFLCNLTKLNKYVEHKRNCLKAISNIIAVYLNDNHCSTLHLTRGNYFSGNNE